MRRWTSAAVGVAAVVVIAGCSSTQPGQPITAANSNPTSLPSTSAGSAGDQAPRVHTPLNDTRLVNDPCSALTAPQLRGMGLTTSVKTHVEHLAVGNVCDWNDDTIGDAGASAGVVVQTTLSHGLSDIYAQRPGMAYFTAVTIEGYPAVFADLIDQRASGTCSLNLGVPDTSVLAIDYQQVDLGPTACDKAQAIARAVVETLRGT